MLIVLGNRESVPQLFSFKPSDSSELDYELLSIDELAQFVNADTLVLTPEMLSFCMEHNIPMFGTKKEAREQAKKLPESAWRYWNIYIPCMPPNYPLSKRASLDKSKMWDGRKML